MDVRERLDVLHSDRRGLTNDVLVDSLIDERLLGRGRTHWNRPGRE